MVQNAATSTLVGYTVSDTAQITAGAVLGTPCAGWTVVGRNPTTFIDGTGSNLALAGTPGPDQYNLTSYAGGIHTISGFDPAQDTLALSKAAFPSYAAVQANEAPLPGRHLHQPVPHRRHRDPGHDATQMSRPRRGIRFSTSPCSFTWPR